MNIINDEGCNGIEAVCPCGTMSPFKFFWTFDRQKRMSGSKAEMPFIGGKWYTYLKNSLPKVKMKGPYKNL